MIKVASEQEIPQILNLVEGVFPNHSLVKREKSLLREQIKNEKYISFVERTKDKRLIGHGGFSFTEGLDFFRDWLFCLNLGAKELEKNYQKAEFPIV